MSDKKIPAEKSIEKEESKVDSIAMIIARLYKTYYDLNKTLTPIHELKGKYELIYTDPRYEVPIICSLFLQIFFESEKREEWGTMLDSMYEMNLETAKKNGFDEYEAAIGVTEMFAVKWEHTVDAKGNKVVLPRIEFGEKMESVAPVDGVVDAE